ncbi:MAG: LLM class flavin-dependent oxidoreductase [Alphaproteobacteria bacterium]|nr:LLM class flavin-dependent oxidoreductase [Alphaproteobacteria bacterium]
MAVELGREPKHPDDLRQWRRDHLPVYNANRLKLGVFGQNCSYGCTITHADTTFEPSYEHSVKISKLADALGFELLVPVGRWKHFGGSTKFNGTSMEVFTWATAMACHTENIMVFATSHVPTVHPIFAAKQAATIDHISNGRFGLNVVCGWFKPEMEMFGIKQLGHDTRYEVADEWLTCMKRLWTEEEFSHQGKYFTINQGWLSPKPIQQPHPVIINAGSSPAGRDFSARHADFNFVSIPSLEKSADMTKDIHRRAASYSRQCGVMSYGLVCCRDTENEAKALYDRIVAEGDWGATRTIIDLMQGENYSYGSNQDEIRAMGERFIAGWGGYPLVGTPEQVVEKMLAIADTGVEGFILSWLDYYEEIKYFGEKVMPLMRQAGLRT